MATPNPEYETCAGEDCKTGNDERPKLAESSNNGEMDRPRLWTFIKMLIVIVVLLILLLGACIVTIIIIGRIECSKTGALEEKYPEGTNHTAEAIKWLQLFNKEYPDYINRFQKARWDYHTNITDQTGKRVNQAAVEYNIYLKGASIMAASLNVPGVDDDSRRQLTLITLKEASPRDIDQLQELTKIKTKQGRIFSTATVCMKHGQFKGKNATCLGLQPGLEKLMETSNDTDEMLWAWTSWRNATGRKIRQLFPENVRLLNVGARDNGYRDVGEYWRKKALEISWVRILTYKLFEEMRPLYAQLFCYVRRKLHRLYGDAIISDPNGPIPAHIIGSIFSSGFGKLISKGDINPYPEVFTPDVTGELIRQNYTVKKMFLKAEEFFESIGLYSMTDDFWGKSMLVKPKGRDVVCWASAEDFFTQTDFRIKMCTEVSHHSLYVVHHEMGHIEYFIAYRDQPAIYRDGANAGFHEAIGDLIALSFDTTKHLRTIGLINYNETTPEENKKHDINFLMKKALEIIGTLPFNYLLEKWRWDVFSGDITPDSYNRKWWELKLKYQGLVPPIKRTSDDLDAGSMYHVCDNVPFLRYFIRDILIFQFYEALCDGIHRGPLHRCDFYRSKVAGAKLKRTLKMGRSRPWPEAMEAISGQREISTDAMRRYFQPLYDWLRKENEGYSLDWLKPGQTVEEVIDAYFQ